MSRNTKIVIFAIIALALLAPVTFSTLFDHLVTSIQTIWAGISNTGIFSGGH